MSEMNLIREYILRVRELELESDAFLCVTEDVVPVLKEIVTQIHSLTLKDSENHVYYNTLKRLISTFYPFWIEHMDETYKIFDNYSHSITKDEIFDLIHKSIHEHRDKQIDFGRNFLPIKNAAEKTIYGDMQEKYDKFMHKLESLKDKYGEFVKPEEWLPVISAESVVCLENLYKIFDFTNNFIGSFLVGKIWEIEQSLDDIIGYIRQNYYNARKDLKESYDQLHSTLYEANKEELNILRSNHRFSNDIVIVSSRISLIRQRLDELGSAKTLDKIKIMLKYWNRQKDDFMQIANAIKTLKVCQEEDAIQEAEYNSLECKEMPGSKADVWAAIGESFVKRREYAIAKLHQASLALMTHFRFYGNKIKNTDDTGIFIFDPYFYTTYLFNHGLKSYFVNEKGQLEVVEQDKDVYYLDENGRYKLDEKGEKIYQRIHCASLHKMDKVTDLMVKVKESDSTTSVMGSKIPDKDDIEAEREKLVKKDSLTPELVNYIFDTIGHILPYALRDVAKQRPKDPILYLAHRLVVYNHNTPKDVLDKWKEEDVEFRERIYKARREKAIAETIAWKAQFAKRGRDADDLEIWQAFTDHFDNEDQTIFDMLHNDV